MRHEGRRHEAESFGGPTGRPAHAVWAAVAEEEGKATSAARWKCLTPTEGVDFNAYIARVLAIVKRNWYSGDA